MIYLQEDIMKVRKNFEGVFLAAVVVTSLAAYATADAPVASPARPVVVSVVADDGSMPVVVVKAKRLTPEEKLAKN
jgi:hypothetical protein